MVNYIGGDQNPLRQGFFRYVVMVQHLGVDGGNVSYFIQDVDAIAGGQSESWGLAVARTTYFPFSWDCWGHPEYPGSDMDQAIQAKIRALFGVPRLILVGPDASLTLGGVSSAQSSLWRALLSGFNREIDWSLGLSNTPDAHNRAERVRKVVLNYEGSLAGLVVKLGELVLPQTGKLGVETITDYYKKNPPTVNPKSCWVVHDGHRFNYKGSMPIDAVLVPKGKALIEDLEQKGFRFFGTHIPYYSGSSYARVSFEVPLPIDWGTLTEQIIRVGWQNWSQRPTLLGTFITGGRDLVERCMQSARVEGL